MSGDGSEDPNFVKVAGAEGANDAVLSAPAAPAPADFGATGLYATQAYDAANIFLAAIKDGAKDGKAINEFIGKYTGDGVSGPIAFDENGDIKESKIFAYFVKNGKARRGEARRDQLIVPEALTRLRPEAIPPAAVEHNRGGNSFGLRQPFREPREFLEPTPWVGSCSARSTRSSHSATRWSTASCRLINFAHSEVFMYGTFAVAWVFILLHGTGSATWSLGEAVPVLLVALVAACALSAGVALLLERVAYRPLMNKNAPKPDRADLGDRRLVRAGGGDGSS
ncbi:hypothetical protein [Nocardioides convexus]|uniref:hypothetical protein n=1 Tax=Nocardioides convexus TaxID=2712224 RepID=UPI0024188459|nr:hypothetical protein [Nocardioides convexus]